jgi:hypothetical protein
MSDKANTSSVFSTDVTVGEFVNTFQTRIDVLTETKIGDTYVLRILQPDFMQFDQGKIDNEVNLVLEVVVSRVEPLGFNIQPLPYGRDGMVMPLWSILGKALGEVLTKQVIEQTDNLLRSIGPVYHICKETDHAIFAFKNAHVLFMNHVNAVTH